jgi:hypothetical protein
VQEDAKTTGVIPLCVCPGFSTFEIPAQPDWRDHSETLWWCCLKVLKAFSRGDWATERHGQFGSTRGTRESTVRNTVARVSETETWGSRCGSVGRWPLVLT